MFNRKKVLIVEPAVFYRQQLKTAIHNHETLIDVIEAETVFQATDIIRDRHPDVIFLYLTDPPHISLTFIESIRKENTPTRITVMAEHPDSDIEAHILASGADAFIVKEQGTSLALIDLIHDMIRR
jgi:DNA-binding NarL/FixJ family response regulator